ncbi:MAG: calcium-binding protein, partial [Jannaschia sp.]
MNLSFAGGAATTVVVSGTTGIGNELRVQLNQIGQTAGQDVTIDFSPIVRGTVNSLLKYSGGTANETIIGSAGDDSINASGGQNSVTGGVGNDTLRADSGFSTLDGGLGDDSIAGSGISGLLSGGAGDDTITQSTGRFESGAYQAVEITGGADNDDISVGSIQGNGSTVRGDAGDDTIRLSGASLLDATLDGGTGTDRLELASSNLTGATISGIESTTTTNNGTNTIDAADFINLGTVTFTNTITTAGSTGVDANMNLSFAGGAATTVDVSGTTGIGNELRVQLNQIGQTAGQDVTIDFSPIVRGTINSLLTYIGGVANETITGTSGDDSINASSGQNSVTGGAGNDTLRADSGFSTLLGGAGDDSIGGSGISGLLSGGTGDDTITQSTGRFESGAYQAVEITGGADNDDISVISIQGNGSTVRGDAGNDTLTFSSANLLAGTVDGGAGDDLLELQSSNLTGTDFSGIEATTILNNGFVTLDASEFVDLGTVTFTDTFPTLGQTIDDANIQLSFAGGAA